MMENKSIIFADSGPYGEDQPSSVIFIGNPSAEGDERKWIKVLAKWDTGATMCAISKELCARLGLSPVQYRTVRSFGFSEGKDLPIDKVLLKLTNGPYTILAEAIVMDPVLPDFDLIIGMNVISAGKFSLTVEKRNISILFEVATDFPYLTKLPDWPDI